MTNGVHTRPVRMRVLGRTVSLILGCIVATVAFGPAVVAGGPTPSAATSGMPAQPGPTTAPAPPYPPPAGDSDVPSGLPWRPVSIDLAQGRPGHRPA